MSLSYNYPPQYAYPSAPPVYRSLPAPPRLHWGWVFALTLVTFGIFAPVWLVVQSLWVKRATQNAKPFGWCLAYLLVLPATVVLAMIAGFAQALGGAAGTMAQVMSMFLALLQFAGFVIYLVAVFTLKGALEAQPIDIPLSGVMTFFFAPFYFQYHLYDYSVEGKVGEQLNVPAAAAAESVAVPVAGVPEVPPQA